MTPGEHMVVELRYALLRVDHLTTEVKSLSPNQRLDRLIRIREISARALDIADALVAAHPELAITIHP